MHVDYVDFEHTSTWIPMKLMPSHSSNHSFVWMAFFFSFDKTRKIAGDIKGDSTTFSNTREAEDELDKGWTRATSTIPVVDISDKLYYVSNAPRTQRNTKEWANSLTPCVSCLVSDNIRTTNCFSWYMQCLFAHFL